MKLLVRNDLCSRHRKYTMLLYAVSMRLTPIYVYCRDEDRSKCMKDKGKVPRGHSIVTISDPVIAHGLLDLKTRLQRLLWCWI